MTLSGDVVSDEGYTREELKSLGPNDLPTRGLLCPRCGARIPIFVDLAQEDDKRLRALAAERPVDATKELMRLTGCRLSWAKPWVLHPNGPKEKEPDPPCPFCGSALRTKN